MLRGCLADLFPSLPARWRFLFRGAALPNLDDLHHHQARSHHCPTPLPLPRRPLSVAKPRQSHLRRSANLRRNPNPLADATMTASLVPWLPTAPLERRRSITHFARIRRSHVRSGCSLTTSPKLTRSSLGRCLSPCTSHPNGQRQEEEDQVGSSQRLLWLCLLLGIELSRMAVRVSSSSPSRRALSHLPSLQVGMSHHSLDEWTIRSLSIPPSSLHSGGHSRSQNHSRLADFALDAMDLS